MQKAETVAAVEKRESTLTASKMALFAHNYSFPLCYIKEIKTLKIVFLSLFVFLNFNMVFKFF